MTFLTRLSRSFLGELRGVTDLIAPVTCCGCGAFDALTTPALGTPLCRQCRPRVTPHLRRVERSASAWSSRTSAPVWAIASYDQAWREVILNFKNRGRSDGLPLLQQAGEKLGAHLAGLMVSHGDDNRRPLRSRFSGIQSAKPLTVIPAPTRKPSWLSGRELNLPALIANSMTRELHQHGLEAESSQLLRNRYFARDQIGMTARARLNNRLDSMRVTKQKDLSGQHIVLVDDVLTTGATMLAAFHAVTRAGAIVLGAAVIAATPKRTDERN